MRSLSFVSCNDTISQSSSLQSLIYYLCALSVVVFLSTNFVAALLSFLAFNILMTAHMMKMNIIPMYQPTRFQVNLLKKALRDVEAEVVSSNEMADGTETE